ncbi:MAG: hypothetical protein MZV64_19985 [Ignavibacteriales bacterium]|nr:hypothetical protein [Ignavibacteriales bacterium]
MPAGPGGVPPTDRPRLILAHRVGVVAGDRGVVDRIRRDRDCVGVAQRPAGAAVALVVGDELEAGSAVEVRGGREGEVVEGGVDRRDRARERHRRVGAAVARAEAEPRRPGQRERSVGRRERDLHRARRGVDVADRDRVAVPAREDEGRALARALGPGHGVERRVVGRGDVDGGGVGARERAARAGVAQVAGREGQCGAGRRSVAVGGVGERAAEAAGEQVVDLGERAVEGHAGGARAGHGDAGGAGRRGEDAAGHRHGRPHGGAAGIDIGNRQPCAVQRQRHLLGRRVAGRSDRGRRRIVDRRDVDRGRIRSRSACRRCRCCRRSLAVQGQRGAGRRACRCWRCRSACR